MYRITSKTISGITLIELMLALFISIFILSSLTSVYFAIISINQTQIALTTIIENSNMAFNFIKSDLKSGGKINNYFIATTKRKNKRGYPIYALYYFDNKHHKTELVEGINTMKIQYTILKKNQIMSVDENQISNDSHIIGISIMLNLSSVNEINLNKNEYFYVSI